MCPVLEGISHASSNTVECSLIHSLHETHHSQAAFGVWATGLSASLLYQWTRPIPTQMKIIHSRVYAQGFTLAALSAAALISWTHEDEDREKQLTTPTATGSS